ncbi:MAG: hypothetical protein UX24_C0010G0002 [Candidatus Giovannonibacteria bacterium GW2011_GWB1_45_9b]|uniref:Uncharacterized protein n=7 Tax=Candidatus Giovannoniibacteriota TaxID=1752738 RepID=A0A1F5WYV4_9BACT|nr:MAG: hypothetical protein UW74_C0009G0012 [Candidatus Giovannonibacteria bacterium GW2011_GWC2_44_8]KKU04664.1 MAG: hypothetical protein UX06_C0012G0019 [Candidatus Giovannonibacteria bacterium GW2011_GWA2_45_21]KKU16431.1 MAG: hypothetical protein UX24_C0010G0002 [Candidatus Giovannonibacteria bacterium GW2011_GWB1_45_9b]OGF73377.1 MAG: hypothetical protein A2W57_02200 [Candidatus Giovannonibacteria bacterium RIFCSPHIGHO2_02_43_16]OGF80818.1 MAG: hypothetical protein A2W48_02305 [Candidatus
MKQEESMKFESDVLTEDDYLRINRSRLLDPEKSLMLAVLDDAIDCYQKYYLSTDAKDKDLFRDAEFWLMGQKSDWPFHS